MKDAPAAAPVSPSTQADGLDTGDDGDLDVDLQALIDGIAALGRVDSLLEGVQAEIGAAAPRAADSGP